MSAEIVIRVRFLDDASEHEAVRQLGEHIGWGNVMHLAERCWREYLQASGAPAGGEHTTGPCAIFMVPCPCARTGESCDWCCGARRVTQRVR